MLEVYDLKSIRTKMTTIADHVSPDMSRNIKTSVIAKVKARVPETLQKMQALKLNPKDLRTEYVTARNDVRYRAMYKQFGGDTRARLREKLQKA